MRRVPAHVRRALLGRSEDFSAEIAAADLPMATLHGDLDSVVLPAMSQAIAALRPGIESTTLAGTGHLPAVEAPQAFEAALRALAARVKEAVSK
jgi:pimeloyl-ACP methyl ester carboxylesterase